MTSLLIENNNFQHAKLTNKLAAKQPESHTSHAYKNMDFFLHWHLILIMVLAWTLFLNTQTVHFDIQARNFTDTTALVSLKASWSLTEDKYNDLYKFKCSDFLMM